MLGRIRGPLGPRKGRSSTGWLMLPGGHTIEVAGILRHQKSLERIVASRSEGGPGPDALTATLFRDTTDPKDPTAVAVALVVPGELEALRIGYLTRELAVDFCRVLKTLENHGLRGAACGAALTSAATRRSHGRYEIGVTLDLASRARVEQYLTAVRKNPDFLPTEFDEDPQSARFKTQSGWRVPGWLE